VQDDIINKNREFEFRYNRMKRSKNFLFLISIMILSGLALFTFSFFFDISSDTVNIIIFADMFFIIIASLYWYLQVQPLSISYMPVGKDIRTSQTQGRIESINEIEKALLIYDTAPSVDEKNEDVTNELVKYISDRTDVFPYENQFRKIDTSILTNKTKRKLFGISLQTLKDRLSEQNTKEDEQTKNKSAEESDKDKSLERMANLVDITTTRLKAEIAQLSKRADIYIIFGSGITLIGGVFLYFTVQELLEAYSVSSSQGNASINASEIFSVVIRLSIVVFIEVFAFYYLRLYRNIMENIKYYQNEITNIEMKILSLHALEGSNCNESLKALTSELAKTERNFVIDKNKTTVDLERNKLESDFFKSSTDNFVKLIKSIKS
jgi:hypothetical protein